MRTRADMTICFTTGVEKAGFGCPSFPWGCGTISVKMYRMSGQGSLRFLRLTKALPILILQTTMAQGREAPRLPSDGFSKRISRRIAMSS